MNFIQSSTDEFVKSGSVRLGQPPIGDALFNGFAEASPPEERQRLRDERMRRLLSWAAKETPFYQQFFAGHGVDATQISGKADLHELPILDKELVRDAQLAAPPFGNIISQSRMADLAHIVKTSGTTGAPTLMAWSRQDWRLAPEVLARNLWSAGLRPGMGLVHLWPIGGAQIGSIWVRDAAERCGAVPLNIGGRDFMLEPEPSADFIKRVGTGMPLGAVTSFALAEKIGRELADRDVTSPFRFLFLAGQPSTSAMRKALKALHPQAETFDMWASTEVQTFAECSAGRHHLQEDLIVHEVVDPITGKPAKAGEKGIVVVTSLIQHTMPLIRFSMDDVVVNSVVDEPCDCGRHQPTFTASILGRSSDLFTVSGRQFLPSDVQMAFDGVGGLTGVLQIVARKDGQDDRLRVRAEASREAPPDLADELNRRLESDLNVAAAVELVEPGAVEMASSAKTQLIAWES